MIYFDYDEMLGVSRLIIDIVVEAFYYSTCTTPVYYLP